MRCLHDIDYRNALAIEASIPRQLAAGKHVVAEYSAAGFQGYETFSGDNAEQMARAKVLAINCGLGAPTYARLFSPKPQETV